MYIYRNGFTLLELTITLLIVAILSIITIPALEHTFQNTKANIMEAELMRAIHLARSEAIMRGTTVTLCKSQNELTCGGDWQDGFLILSEDQQLFSFHHNHSPGVLHWRAFPVFLDHLEFLSSGLPNFQNGTFWYCLDNPVWAIVISQSGRARVVYPDASGKIKDEKDQPLECGNNIV